MHSESACSEAFVARTYSTEEQKRGEFQQISKRLCCLPTVPWVLLDGLTRLVGLWRQADYTLSIQQVFRRTDAGADTIQHSPSLEPMHTPTQPVYNLWLDPTKSSPWLGMSWRQS